MISEVYFFFTVASTEKFAVTLIGYIEHGVILLRLILKSVQDNGAIILFAGVLTTLTPSLSLPLVYVCTVTSLRDMCSSPFGG